MRFSQAIWPDMLATPGTNRALLLIVATALLAVSANGLIRTLSGTMHPFEIAFFRALVALLVFIPLLSRSSGVLALFKTQRMGLQLIRGGFQGVSMLLFFLAISLAPLAKVSALGFSSPVFASILATLILGEVVRARRIVALGIGVVGTLVIVQPGFQPLDLGTGVVLASSALAGVSFVMIKVLARTDASITTILFGALVAAPVSLIASIPYWTTPSIEQALPLIGVGVLASLSNLCRAQALKEADLTIVAPFEFLKLPLSAIIGYAAFAEIPEIWTWIGGTTIFLAATYLAYRERQIKKAGSTAR